MSLHLIPFNGKSNFIEYEVFENQLKESLERTCTEATLAIFNNFPVITSPEVKTDIVMTLAIKKIHKNYYREIKNNNSIYLQNAVLSFSCINSFEKSQIEVDTNNDLSIDNILYDYSNDLQSLKFGLRDYLVNRCSFEKNDLNIIPVVFIKNPSYSFYINGIIVAPALDWNIIKNYIFEIATQNISSCRKWNKEFGYEDFKDSIKIINDKASEDSSFGFLTKKKIDRIAKRISKVDRQKRANNKQENLLFDTETLSDLIIEELDELSESNISNNLILLDGKAGTGKTTELINLMIKNLRNNRNARFMTYNHLLVYDISKTLKSFTNSSLLNSSENEPIGKPSVMTLHAYFFRLSRSLGILHLMTEERIESLNKILLDRTLKCLEELKYLTTHNGARLGYSNAALILKELITNTIRLNQAEKEVGVDFLNYLHKNNLSITNNLEDSSKKFIKLKKASLETICINKIFISDYYGVLKNILRSISNPAQFYKDFSIESKFELLFTTMEYGRRYLDNKDLQNGIIPEEIYVKRVNKVKAGHKLGNPIILIDEGQDCHRDEKEVLFSIFSPNNIAVASGGKEQLIRHVELCNWTASQGLPIPHNKYKTGKKSYRIKKNLLSLCNFVASKFNIAFDLEPLDSDDVGEIIIDSRKDLNSEQSKQIFERLLIKGELNECTPYESLLILLNSRNNNQNNDFETSVVINEYGNIEEQYVISENEWEFTEALGEVTQFWKGTNDETRKHSIPSYGETRVIYYNSCRGLEAWSVACFDIDNFFNKKRAEKDAEIYLTDTVFTLEDRKSMYAATWTLMAMTRAIDTMYLKVSNKDSEFGKVLIEYSKLYPNHCNVFI